MRAAILICVGAAAAFAIVRYPLAVSELHEEARRHSSHSYADREFAGGNGIVVDQEVFYQARARIPESAAYHVKVVRRVPGATDLTVPYVSSFATYFLMPRRQAEDAPWVICYGCRRSDLPERAHIVWAQGAGISIARIDR
jgi:hypothetical protein